MNTFQSYEDHPILAELYDFLPRLAERTDRDYYVEQCRADGGSVLELGCGTGRILLPSAETGCRVTGLDLSEHMLARCRSKLAGLSDEVRACVSLVQGTMCDFALDRSFDLVIIPFRAFQHLITVDDQVACLSCINRHLASGGRLIFDVYQVNMALISSNRFQDETEIDAEFEMPHGRRARRAIRMRHHRAEQYNQVEFVYYVTDAEGRTERIVHTFPHRYFFRYEVEHLLARTGFDIQHLFGNFDQSPLGDDSPEMIFVAEKRREAD